ncbi:hypothetical protein QT236_14530 [Geobacillus stearothermophilus]|nr:hypothetical protein QT236_12690 [Geobacillus stearothermophilus]WJQ03235.1 hypothetical protein QT236_14530 [Geobacillus stearothermophilus]
MNALEHYIKEIISVEPYEAEWTKEFDEKFLRIRVVTNCYGDVREHEVIETEKEWEEAKKRGYFFW